MASIKNILRLLMSIGLTKGDEVEDLRKQCFPCTAYGFRYCADDANLVNLNGDKCYQYATDKAEFCEEFNFYENRLLCDEIQIATSPACDPYQVDNMQYYTVQESTLTLEPRSSCGFFLYEYTAFLDIRHQYPISLYHREYKQV